MGGEFKRIPTAAVRMEFMGASRFNGSLSVSATPIFSLDYRPEHALEFRGRRTKTDSELGLFVQDAFKVSKKSSRWISACAGIHFGPSILRTA